MSSSSEQFEKWRKDQIASLIRTGHVEAARAFEQLGSIHWMAWQSSRAALVVTLPEEEYFGDSWSGGYAITRENVVDALEEQGLRVAP